MNPSPSLLCTCSFVWITSWIRCNDRREPFGDWMRLNFIIVQGALPLSVCLRCDDDKYGPIVIISQLRCAVSRKDVDVGAGGGNHVEFYFYSRRRRRRRHLCSTKPIEYTSKQSPKHHRESRRPTDDDDASTTKTRTDRPDEWMNEWMTSSVVKTMRRRRDLLMC